MTWTFDISTAPRGRQEGRSFNPDWIWIATTCGKVIRSHWIPEKGKDGGRWLALNKGSEPMAWQSFVTPEHPVMTGAQLVDALDAMVPATSADRRLCPGDAVTISPELSASLGFAPGMQFLINDVGGGV